MVLAGLVRMRAWHSAIVDACPEQRIGYRDVLAAHLGGAGFNGILPAHGGDAVKLGLLKRRFPEAPFGFLLGSLGQLIANVAGWADQEIWDVEDEQLLQAARLHLQQLVPPGATPPVVTKS